MILKFIIVLLIILQSKVVSSQEGWYQLVSGTYNNLRSIFFTDINTGYAVGFYGTILKTTNGGLNWIHQIIGTNENLYSVHFIGQTGYAVGGTMTPTIAKTTNGGTNWELQQFSWTYQLGSVFMTDSVTAHASGYRRMLKTTNGGINWNVQFMDTVIGFPAYFSSIFFVDDNTGFVGGNNLMHYGGVFCKTTNGGISWLGGFAGAPLRSINFIDSETGYSVVTSEFKAIKTTNSGVNWTSQYLGNGNKLNSIWFTNLTTGHIAGSESNNGKIFKTINSGLNWNLQTNLSIAAQYSVFFINDNNGYTAGDSGSILKTVSGGVGIITLSNEIPTEYKLYQNYPNPFNPETKIKFQISKLSDVNLKVFDIRGREITTIVSETLKPGAYEAEFDGSNYPSGIYYYSLITEYYTDTRKMVLTK